MLLLGADLEKFKDSPAGFPGEQEWKMQTRHLHAVQGLKHDSKTGKTFLSALS